MRVRVLLMSAAVLLAAGAVKAAGDDPEPPGGGLKPLQGEWAMQSLGSGKNTSSDLAKMFQVTIKGDQWTLTSAKKGKTTTWQIKVNPSKKPMTIDVFVKDGDKRKIAWRGIYKLEGDVLTVCRTNGDSERPTTFEPTRNKEMLVVWKRSKK